MKVEEVGTSSEGATRTPSTMSFEVFLNFRGLNSRSTIVGVLHDHLTRAGVRVFFDDESIRKGEVIEGELMEAITKSNIYILIFSKDYASSEWCLRELAETMKCWEASLKQEKKKKTIFPIFYDVNVSTDIKLRSELYATALKEHKKKLGEDVVKPWENALQKVAKIKGCDIHHHG